MFLTPVRHTFRSAIRCVRWPAMLSGGKEFDYSKEGAAEPTTRDTASTSADEMDSIWARGMMGVTHSYHPQSDVESKVKENLTRAMAKDDDALTNVDDWRSIDLKANPHLKFKLLLLCERKECFDGRSVPNSRLHAMEAVGDVVDFYNEHAHNTNVYRRFARDEHVPVNLHVIENVKRFHPEDVNELHGGVDAFPGEDGMMGSMRGKRLHRQYRARKEWFEWDDAAHQYDSIPTNAPWSKARVRQMDTVSHGRHRQRHTEGVPYGQPRDSRPDYANTGDMY